MPSSTATKRLPAQERRKQILKCATRIFAQSNFKTATVKQIAAELGISEAAVFNHFPTKKDIFVAILDHVHGRILVGWQAQIDQGKDALPTLRQMGVGYFQGIKEHPDELKVQFQAISEVDDPEIAGRLKAHHAAYVAIVEGLIARGIASGEVRPDTSARSIAYIIDALGVFSNLMHLLGDGVFDVDEANRIVDHLVAPLARS